MEKTKFLLLIIMLMITLSCNPVKQLNQVTAPIIPVEGCAGGFALRAKDAKIIKNDSLALGVLADLSGAAKADLNATDSLLSTGVKANIKANLATSFKKYFTVDQSISEDIWNQSSAFTQLYCMLDKISSDPNVSQAIRDSANNRKISLITTQADYIRNVQKKNQQ